MTIGADVNWMESLLPGIEAMAAGELPIPEAWPAPEPCRHHWVIETPCGPSSPGRCKRCGATGEFANSDPADREWHTNELPLRNSGQVATVKPNGWRKR